MVLLETSVDEGKEEKGGRENKGRDRVARKEEKEGSDGSREVRDGRQGLLTSRQFPWLEMGLIQAKT